MLTRAQPGSLLSRTLRLRATLQSPWNVPKRISSNYHNGDDVLANMRLAIQQRLLAIKSAMTRRRTIVFRTPGFISRAREPITISYTLSNLAGHSSFMLLVISYSESEFLSLRLYALSGITLTILFQYYRDKPLWLPIGWNAMFLFVNAFMVGKLIRDDLAAENMTDEERQIYQSTFEKKGMSKVDFKKFISSATRIVIPAHTTLLKENEFNTRVYLVQTGDISVRKGGTEVGIIRENMFVGEMSFLSWDTKQTELQHIHRRKAALNSFFSKFLRGRETELEEDEEDRSDVRETVQRFQSTVMNMTEKPTEHELDAREQARESHLHSQSATSAENESEPSSLVDAMWDYAWQVTSSVLFPDSSDSKDQTTSSSAFSPSSASEEMDSSSTPAEVFEDQSEGQHAHATVVTSTDCVLYYWSFQEMRKLKHANPQINGIMERCISDDLNRKMFTTWDKEMRERYRQLVLGATSDGHITSEVKEMLVRCRDRLKISDAEHEQVLREVGWTLEEYATGFKGAMSQEIIDRYGEMLRAEISQLGGVTSFGRQQLRQYRAKHSLSSAVHVSALQACGWTLDDYEAGRQGEGEVPESVRSYSAGDAAPSSSRIPTLSWLYSTVTSVMPRAIPFGSPSVVPVSNSPSSAPSSPRLARSIEAVINIEPDV